MHLARQLLEGSWGRIVPDPSLIVAQPEKDGAPLPHAHLVAAREVNGARVWVYCPLDAPFELNLSNLPDAILRAHWFDPRNGQTIFIEEFWRDARHQFKAPGWGPDWVLQLEAI